MSCGSNTSTSKTDMSVATETPPQAPTLGRYSPPLSPLLERRTRPFASTFALFVNCVILIVAGAWLDGNVEGAEAELFNVEKA